MGSFVEATAFWMDTAERILRLFPAKVSTLGSKIWKTDSEVFTSQGQSEAPAYSLA